MFSVYIKAAVVVELDKKTCVISKLKLLRLKPQVAEHEMAMVLAQWCPHSMFEDRKPEVPGCY